MNVKAKIKAVRRSAGKAVGNACTEFRAQTILVPLDFSESSRSALKYAWSLAQHSGGKLILFYSNEPVATPDFAYHPLMKPPAEQAVTAEQELKLICEQEAIDPERIARIVVRSGRAYTQITDTAKSLDVDLIVIATHGNTGLKHVLLGSTTERVVRHAPCPVLVVRV
jgi:universal stress protein A